VSTEPPKIKPAKDDSWIPPLPGVVEALAAVMGELGGIEKLTADQRRARGIGGEQGITYAYRGIDQIAAQVQPLLAKHGVVIFPHVIESHVKEILVRNNPWTDTTVRVEWFVCGPNGSQITACTEGLGRDNSDKGVNKAMTGAFKNLLLRLLCIGDPADDTDGITHERDAAPVAPQHEPGVVALFERVKAAAGTPVADELKAFATENNLKLNLPTLAADPTFAAQVADILDKATT
jgi:hypothetical protein